MVLGGRVLVKREEEQTVTEECIHHCVPNHFIKIRMGNVCGDFKIVFDANVTDDVRFGKDKNQATLR